MYTGLKDFKAQLFVHALQKKRARMDVGARGHVTHHLLLGGLTLYIRTIQLDVVNASSRYSSFTSLFPISTPLARSYLPSTKWLKNAKQQYYTGL